MEEYDYEDLGTGASHTANMLAGAFAGILEHTVMYPIDAIKTRMQVVDPKPAAIYTSMTSAMRRIASTEGAGALWRGINSVILGAGPAHAVYFGVYEFAKIRFGANEGNGHHPFLTGLAGACATITSDALMNPFDVIKQRMQVHGSTYSSVGNCAVTVFRNEGLKAFYVSYPTTLTMTVPFTAVQFSAYESLKKVLNPKGDYDPMSHIVAGGLAGASAAAVTTPLDVIKTVLQTRGAATDPAVRKVNGLWQAGQLIYLREGLRGFGKGMVPRVAFIMPSTAISWFGYELGKYILL